MANLSVPEIETVQRIKPDPQKQAENFCRYHYRPFSEVSDALQSIGGVIEGSAFNPDMNISPLEIAGLANAVKVIGHYISDKAERMEEIDTLFEKNEEEREQTGDVLSW